MRQTGSSPHAWGIRDQDIGHAEIGRFIPTCVGNTIQDAIPFPERAVHPHMRGEYVHQLQGAPGLLGSSPHAWGILGIRPSDARLQRFIPTCVGNTPTRRPRWTEKSVHPHMRGEYLMSGLSARNDSGSSPHAWGIHSPSSLAPDMRRFIPTCVGNTICWSSR